MDDWYFDDDFSDYDWVDLESEITEKAQDENPKATIVNNMNYCAFRRLRDSEKMTYLYNRIRDLYSYLVYMQDVAKEGDK